MFDTRVARLPVVGRKMMGCTAANLPLLFIQGLRLVLAIVLNGNLVKVLLT